MEGKDQMACCPMCGKRAEPIGDGRYMCTSSICKTVILASHVLYKTAPVHTISVATFSMANSVLT